jgi:peptide deformylase
MAVLPIRTLPDPVLRQKAKRVKTIDGSIQKLIKNMLETVHADPGRAALAAPQVGVSLRVIVIDIPGAEDVVMINPEIVKRNGERSVTEGCLSVPGYYGEIKRAKSVTAKGRDASGKEIRIKGEELLAQALEHEVDHLNGMLYIDHLESQDELHKVEDETPQL